LTSTTYVYVSFGKYRRIEKDIERFTSLLPFFGTDYGLCTLIKPQITFDPNLEHIPFETLMINYTKQIKPGIQLGKENGLSVLLDAEVIVISKHGFDYDIFKFKAFKFECLKCEASGQDVKFAFDIKSLAQKC
jgi:hypothetical protein